LEEIKLNIDIADELLGHGAVGGHPHAGRAGALSSLLNTMHGARLRGLSGGPVHVGSRRHIGPPELVLGVIVVVQANPGVRIGVSGCREG